MKSIYKKIKVSKKLHNKLFPNRYRKWYQCKPYYFIDLENNRGEIRYYSSLSLKIFITLVSPIFILLDGIMSVGEIYQELKEIWNDRKLGTFCRDQFPLDEYKELLGL